jgi:hypothetical protein
MDFLSNLLRRLRTLFMPGPVSGSNRPGLADEGDRSTRDRGIARRFLPSNTTTRVLDGTTYWTYQFQCEFRNRYVMAAFFDGREYQVRVLEPDVTGRFSVHHGHLFDDGRICLSPPANGAASLQDAYAKSVVWASGFSIMQHTGKFPFSLNNEDS